MSDHSQEALTSSQENLGRAEHHLAQFGHAAFAEAYDPDLAAQAAQEPGLSRIFPHWHVLSPGVEAAHSRGLVLAQAGGSRFDAVRAAILGHVESLGYEIPGSDGRETSDRLIAVDGTAHARREWNDPKAQGGPFIAITALRGIARVGVNRSFYDVTPGMLIVSDSRLAYSFRPLDGDGALLHTVTGKPVNKVF